MSTVMVVLVVVVAVVAVAFAALGLCDSVRFDEDWLGFGRVSASS